MSDPDAPSQPTLPPDEPDPSEREGRDPWIRFAVTFGVLAVISELVYYGVALESALFRTYLETLASISGFILSLFTDDINVRGTFVTGRVFSVEIARGCDAYRLCSMLTAAMIAFPSSLRLKAWGILLGLLWLNVLNFVRICGLYFIGGNYYAHFQTSHEVYFPIFLIVMTVGAWILWVRRATHESFGPDPSSA